MPSPPALTMHADPLRWPSHDCSPPRAPHSAASDPTEPRAPAPPTRALPPHARAPGHGGCRSVVEPCAPPAVSARRPAARAACSKSRPRATTHSRPHAVRAPSRRTRCVLRVTAVCRSVVEPCAPPPFPRAVPSHALRAPGHGRVQGRHRTLRPPAVSARRPAAYVACSKSRPRATTHSRPHAVRAYIAHAARAYVACSKSRPRTTTQPKPAPPPFPRPPAVSSRPPAARP
jgi:hypothetical protein